MTAFRTKCLDCGKRTRHRDALCESCRQARTTDPIISDPEVENPSTDQTVADTNGGTNTMDGNRNTILGTILRIVLIIFVVIAIVFLTGFALRGCQNSKTNINPKVTPTSAAVVNPTAVPTSSAEPTIAITTPSAEPGLDYPSKTWLFVKAGSVVSADVAIFQGDNNSLKTPLYDNAERTADFVYFATDAHIWIEWGGTVWTPEEVTASTISKFINKKLGDYPIVRFFAYDGSAIVKADIVIYTDKVDPNIVATAINNFNK